MDLAECLSLVGEGRLKKASVGADHVGLVGRRKDRSRTRSPRRKEDTKDRSRYLYMHLFYVCMYEYLSNCVYV